MNSCRTCKWFKNGKCIHDEFSNDNNNKLVEYIEWRFDGDIQAKLNEVIENKLNLSDEIKYELIRDICTCVENDLTSEGNLEYSELEDNFIPSCDFVCAHYE